MRGGALPLLGWAALLAVLLATCAIWTGEAIEAGVLAFAVVAILVSAGAAVLGGGREALARGAPERQRERPEPVPNMSLGAALAAVGLGALLFGLVFGHFLVFFGAVLVALGAGRAAVELRGQRASLERFRTHPGPGEEEASSEEQR